MIRKIGVAAAVLGGALLVGGTSEADQPFAAMVYGYTDVVTPTTIRLEVFDDNRVVVAPTAVQAHVAFRGTELRSGDTATAHFYPVWDPDSEVYTNGLTIADAQFRPDGNGTFNGNLSSAIHLSAAQQRYAHWCHQVGEGYQIPGSIMVKTDRVYSYDTQPTWNPVKLEVHCLASITLGNVIRPPVRFTVPPWAPKWTAVKK